MSAFLVNHIVAYYFRNHGFISLDVQSIVVKYFGGNEEKFVVYSGDNIKLSEDRMTASIKENLYEYVTVYGNVIIDTMKDREIAEYIWNIDVAKCILSHTPIFIGIDSSPIINCLKMRNFANKSMNKHSFFAFGFDGRAYAQNIGKNGKYICHAIENSQKMKLVLNVKKKTLMLVIDRLWSPRPRIWTVAKQIDLSKKFRFAASMKYKEETVKILEFEASTKEIDWSIRRHATVEELD